MYTDVQQTVDMFTAASSFGRGTGLLFMATNEGVTCYAPVGRKEDAEHFVKELQSIYVDSNATNHVDWEIDNSNRPSSSNLDVLHLQAALEAAGLSSKVLVFANNGIKINTNGPILEVYQALNRLLHTKVSIHEGQFFNHC